ncbi:MAG: PspC domain-containing protein [Thalassotalea sp.]
MAYQVKYPSEKKLLKDTSNSWLAGVCSGIANYYQAPRFAVRLITFVCFMSLPKLVALSYIIAAICLSKR